jgi:hemerythrin-like domain-containing protein
MTTATEILRKEHDAILRMLDTAEAAAAQLEKGVSVPARVLDGLVEFFRLFADRCHHGKEEELLFPLLEKKGMPRRGGPIGVMLFEHEAGRDLVRRMAQAAEEHKTNVSGAGIRWAAAARGYIPLLRDHIAKENNVLFVMAERTLSDDEQRQLAAEFEKVETEKMGPGTHERLHALMDELNTAVLAR